MEQKKDAPKNEETAVKKTFKAPELRRHDNLPVITAGSINLNLP